MKNILLFVLIFTLILSFSSCSKKKDSDTAPETTAIATDSTTDTAPVTPNDSETTEKSNINTVVPEYNSDNTVSSTKEYDSKGMVIKETFFQNGKMQETIAFEYYDNGNIKKETRTDEDGKLIHSYMREYNEFNTITAEYSLDLEGNILVKEEMTYNERQLLLTHVKHDMKTNVILREEYEYTSVDEIQKVTCYNGTNIEWRKEYAYDESYRLISITQYDKYGKVVSVQNPNDEVIVDANPPSDAE